MESEPSLPASISKTVAGWSCRNLQAPAQRNPFLPSSSRAPRLHPAPGACPGPASLSQIPCCPQRLESADPAPSCQVCVSRVEMRSNRGANPKHRVPLLPFSLSPLAFSLSCLSCGLSSAWKTCSHLLPSFFPPSLLPSSKIFAGCNFPNYFKSALRSGFLFWGPRCVPAHK